MTRNIPLFTSRLLSLLQIFTYVDCKSIRTGNEQGKMVKSRDFKEEVSKDWTALAERTTPILAREI